MSTFKIKPADPDVVVRDPITRKPLAAKGEEKPKNSYWLRRLGDKDVELLSSKPKTTGGNQS